MNIEQYWLDVLRQDTDAMRSHFHPNAKIYWHNTNEQFTVEEFILANCEYPGNWTGNLEQLIYTDSQVITALHIYSTDETLQFHVTSFIQIQDGKIVTIDEYWGDDGPAPQWRQEMSIGRKIKK